MSIHPRAFAQIISGVAIFVGVLFLAVPVTADIGGRSIACGDGFSGISRDAELADAGASIWGDTSGTATEECGDSIGIRRGVGWSLIGVGAVALAGAVFVRSPQRPAA